MIVASIDIGTNTILMLIAEVKGNKIKPILNEYSIPRIGKGVIKGGNISDEKIQLLIDVLKDFKKKIAANKCNSIICSATNAFRIAANSDIVKSRVLEETGIDINIITGETEALYSYYGAVWDHEEKETLVIDIGGGSTELIIGKAKNILYKKSFPIGVVMGTEQYFYHDPPTREEYYNFINYVRNTFSNIPLDIKPLTAIAIAGTPTTLSCISLGLESFDEEKVEGSIIKLDDLVTLENNFLEKSSSELLIEYKAVVKGREDVLLAGTIILHIVMESFGMQSVYVSTKGIRYGAIVAEYLL